VMGGAILSHLTLLGMMFTGGLIGESKYETLSALAEATRSGWRKVSLSGRAI
jgi:hypothetical protein